MWQEKLHDGHNAYLDMLPSIDDSASFQFNCRERKQSRKKICWYFLHSFFAGKIPPLHWNIVFAGNRFSAAYSQFHFLFWPLTANAAHAHIDRWSIYASIMVYFGLANQCYVCDYIQMIFFFFKWFLYRPIQRQWCPVLDLWLHSTGLLQGTKLSGFLLFTFRQPGVH